MVGPSGLTARLRRPKPADVAFAVAIVAIIGAYVVMIVGHLRLPLEYDEAYNMTVVENFGERFFYGTNGALFPDVGGPVLFDPYITTGPTLLLPASLMCWASGGTLWATRLVPVAFFVLYLAGAWVATRGILGRWYRLLALVGPFALVVPVAFEHAAFVPTRLVGETTAAAMILWGVLLAERGRLWWGGVVLGLAVQTKYVAVIPAAVALTVVIVLTVVRARNGALRRVLAAVGGAVIPTLVFEVIRMLTLGWDDYRNNLDATINYSRSVAQIGDKESSDAMTKLTSLGNMFETHSFLIVASTVFVLVAMASFAVVSPWSGRVKHPQRRSMPNVVSNLVLAGGSSLLFWLLVVQERSGRHALPGLLLLFPGLALLLGYLVQSIEPRRFARVPVAAALIVASGFLIVDSATKAISGLGRESILDEQVRVAEILEGSDTPTLDVDGWWQRPEFQILTDLPVETSGPQATVIIFDSIQVGYELSNLDMLDFDSSELYADKCAYLLFKTGHYVMCRPSR